MEKKIKKEKMKLSYESDDKMGRQEKLKETNSKQTEFFNTTQSSE